MVLMNGKALQFAHYTPAATADFVMSRAPYGRRRHTTKLG